MFAALDRSTPSLDLNKLNLRSSRKVGKFLGIKQKSNGRSIPVKELRLQIQQQLQVKPELTSQIQQLALYV